MAALLLCLQLQLLLLSLLGTAASSSSLPAPAPVPVPASVCMPGITAPFLLRQALPFCGGTVGSSTCCTVEEDAKLHQEFMEDLLKNHDFYGREPRCTSAVKAIICAVCVPSAPADDPPCSSSSNASNTTTVTNKNNSALPLRCAGAATVTQASISTTKDLDSNRSTSPSSTESPTLEWMNADDNKAPTTPKLLIALIVSVLATLLGSYAAYKICKARLECCNNNQCCSNNECCLCCL